MIQFNLLPDVKLEYAKTRKTKRIVMLGALSATALAIFILVLLFLIVNVFQKKHLSNLNTNIAKKTKELEETKDLKEILTIQNQLKSINGLHDQKPATNRLYDYLIRVTPKDAKIATAKIDFENSTIELDGSALNLETINKFADTLKFTTFTVDEQTKNAFSEVVLKNFGIEQKNEAGRSTYTVSVRFDKTLFDITKKVDLTVPNKISTRSEVDISTDLFEQVPTENPEQGGEN